jgi:hypothetical protein
MNVCSWPIAVTKSPTPPANTSQANPRSTVSRLQASGALDFRIQIVRIEALYPGFHGVVLRVAEVLVFVFFVPRVEALEANHVERCVVPKSIDKLTKLVRHVQITAIAALR